MGSLSLAQEMKSSHEAQSLESGRGQDVGARHVCEHLPTPQPSQTKEKIEGKLNEVKFLGLENGGVQQLCGEKGEVVEAQCQ